MYTETNSFSSDYHTSILTDAVLTSGCICTGDIVTYECTAMETEAIIWTGSAFNCQSSGNEIVLLPRSYRIYAVTCNNGATFIAGQNLALQGNHHTSQLNVTTTPDIAGKTVECHRDNGTTTTLNFL